MGILKSKFFASLTSVMVMAYFAIAFFAIAQESAPAASTPPASPDLSTPQDTTEKKTKIFLLNADSLVFDDKLLADAQILYGNVKFRHDSAYMYCDSAYFFELNNTLEAFSNVRIEQGDTLFIYSDFLVYDGNTQLAKVRENVKMENKNVTLLTDSLDYDRRANVAYYLYGGIISDTTNVLTSRQGTYYPNTKVAYFQEDVKLENDNFNMVTDSLEYNTETGIAYIIAPSDIVTDSTNIKTANGWYDTKSENSLLLDRSLIINKSQTITGDSLLYDKLNGIGQLYGNVVMRDTTENISLLGEYAFYNEKDTLAFVTDSALMIQYGKQDTLYLHADTIKSIPDSTFKVILAYKGVRFFRTGGQGVCDSMSFPTRDSVLKMYRKPILWSNENQITGDSIYAFMNDSTIDHAIIQERAFSIQKVDTLSHNQLSGKKMTAHFEDGGIRRIDIEGNVETIFYPLEVDSTCVGLNKAVSSFLTIYMLNQKIERLIMWPSVEGSITPLEKVKDDDRQLKGFSWFGELRPTDPQDVFRPSNRGMLPEDEPRRRRKK